MGIALIARSTGWISTPWWIILIVSILAFTLWWRGHLGGADAKGWIVFGILGTPVLLGATIGQLIWYLSVNWGRERLQSQAVGTPIPGFPGYALGIWLFSCYLISFKMLGVFLEMVRV